LERKLWGRGKGSGIKSGKEWRAFLHPGNVEASYTLSRGEIAATIARWQKHFVLKNQCVQPEEVGVKNHDVKLNGESPFLKAWSDFLTAPGKRGKPVKNRERRTWRRGGTT